MNTLSWYPEPSTGHREVAPLLIRTLAARNVEPEPRHPAPYSLRPAPCTLHPAPYTLHPAPRRAPEPLDPTPQTPNPTHQSLTPHTANTGMLAQTLILYCRTTSASTVPCTSRRTCCPTHGASYCALCQPPLRAFSRWIRSPPRVSHSVLGSRLASKDKENESIAEEQVVVVQENAGGRREQAMHHVAINTMLTHSLQAGGGHSGYHGNRGAGEPYAPNPTSHTQNPKPYTLKNPKSNKPQTPNPLNPEPYTPYPTPCTLHPLNLLTPSTP